MKRMISAATAALAAAVVGVLAQPAPPASATAYTWHGCPSGALCIYPQNAGWNGDHPSNIYYSYGYHRLYNQYGYHYVLNNQTSTGAAYLTSSLPPADKTFEFWHDEIDNVDLTPYNYVELYETA